MNEDEAPIEGAIVAAHFISDEGDSEETDPEVSKILEEESMLIQGNFAPGTSPTRAYAGVNRPRFLLPERRDGWTQE